MIKFESSSDLPKECPFCHRRLIVFGIEGLYMIPAVMCIFCLVDAAYSSPRLKENFQAMKSTGRVRTFFWRLKWLYYAHFRGAFV